MTPDSTITAMAHRLVWDGSSRLGLGHAWRKKTFPCGDGGLLRAACMGPYFAGS